MANRVVVLAGPGVLGNIDGFRRWTATHNLPVANTWSVKGLFAWNSPHHMGTVGLQARDFDLAGFAAAERIFAVGVDEDETPRAWWALSDVDDFDVEDLPEMEVQPEIEPNDLYTRLADVIQPLYRSVKSPPSPARVLTDLAAARPDGAVVAARPGLTGFWVARAFPTTELGSVVVAEDPPSGARLIEWSDDDVDWSDTDALVAVAGDIVAFGGVPWPP